MKPEFATGLVQLLAAFNRKDRAFMAQIRQFMRGPFTMRAK